MLSTAPINKVEAHAYRIPASSVEQDGTYDWDNTTLIIVHVHAAGIIGLGYSYASRSCVSLIYDSLADATIGKDAFNISESWHAMCWQVRNFGRSGIAACAISAVDNALWDLKAKLLDVPMAILLGKAKDSIPVYGSGGFTNYNDDQFISQIESWKRDGITQFKIKIGRDDLDDMSRIKTAHDALPKNGKLFVDANGAYHPKQAMAMAEKLSEYDVRWFEEPVSSDDVSGLAYMREHSPALMDIAAGEYSFTLDDSRRLLENQAVDMLQIDATRCMGITGFIKAAALAESFHRPISSHCAPALHSAVMCHLPQAVHSEYFWDHARIEQMLFDGVPLMEGGMLTPQCDRPGFGFEFKDKDAEAYAV